MNNTGLPTYIELLEYYDSSCGCYVIDKHPSKVDIDWIRQNHWRLEPIDSDRVCIDCKTDLLRGADRNAATTDSGTP